MLSKKLRAFLDDNEIRYVIAKHSAAFTSQEIAQTVHVKGQGFAKTVMVRVDGKMAMAVLPATFKVDFDLLKDAIGADDVELATEEEFKSEFPDCEVGAMPPFGNLYGMDVYMASGLTEDDQIAFNAGTHTDVVQMAFGDFTRLVEPKVIRFSVPA